MLQGVDISVLVIWERLRHVQDVILGCLVLLCLMRSDNLAIYSLDRNRPRLKNFQYIHIFWTFKVDVLVVLHSVTPKCLILDSSWVIEI